MVTTRPCNNWRQHNNSEWLFYIYQQYLCLKDYFILLEPMASTKQITVKWDNQMALKILFQLNTRTFIYLHIQKMCIGVWASVSVSLNDEFFCLRIKHLRLSLPQVPPGAAGDQWGETNSGQQPCVCIYHGSQPLVSYRGNFLTTLNLSLILQERINISGILQSIIRRISFFSSANITRTWLI